MLRTAARRRWVEVAGALGTAMALVLMLAAVATAHAELQVATPKDGSTVAGSPTEISGTYSEAMKVGGSRLTLVGPDGKTFATGGVDTGNDQRMAIDPVPALAPGTYIVKSTTVSAQDGDVDRKQWSFTVAPAASSPSSSPTPGGSGSVTPSGTPLPTTAPSPRGPSPSADVSGTGGSGDVLLPIIAGLAIVAVGAGLLVGRRGRSGPSA